MATVTYSWNQDFDFSNKVINTTTAGDQSAPAVAAIANVGGGTGAIYHVDFIASWDDPGNGGDSLFRTLTAKGTQPDSFGDFGSSAGFQSSSSLAGYADGGYVRVFVSDTSDPDGDIRFVVSQPGHDTNGLVTDNATADSDPDVAVLADGGFVVTWTRGTSDVIRKVFNEFGSVRAEETAVDGGTNGSQPKSSSVAALSGGGFVVAFEESYMNIGIFLHRVLFRRYDANGVALDTIPAIIDDVGSANQDIQVLGLEDGGFVVAYTDNEFGTGTDIHARIYDANGSERIDLGRINDFTTGAQDKPALTLMSNGYFVVGWQNQGLLKVQAFDPEGTAIGLQADQGGMIDADIAGLADGRLVSVRSSSASDVFPGSSNSIRASAYDLVRTTVGDATNETLLGDGLIDVISGAGGRDRISGGGANDTLNGGAGRDTVSGGAGNDSIAGGSSGDVLDGGRGADTVTGGIGDDRVGGAQGQDQLAGNAGADTYIFAALSHSGVTAATRDVIIDFEDGTDTIDVSGIDAVAGGVDQEFIFGGPFTAGHIRARQSGADTILQFNTDADTKAEMTILLKNVLATTLDADDFVL